MATIIYGSELAMELKEEMKEEVSALAREKRVPCLAVILVGDNPASLSYVTAKEKACQEIGLTSKPYRLPATSTQAEVEEVIKKCAKDEEVDGILLQLPLPKGLNEAQALECIPAEKDVDGLTTMNVGKFFLGQDSFVPCTPLGIMEILKKMNCEIDGKRAVVIGRSKLVGTPIARLLQNAGATVTICHSRTKDLPSITKEADILVAAVGKPQLFGKEYVKDGAYVIDVGVNRLENGKLCGDMKFDEVEPIAAAITPVPKGVGPMTICMLLRNTIEAYKKKEGI